MQKTPFVFIFMLFLTLNLFSQNLMEVNKNGKWGVIDKEGNIILQRRYNNVKISPFGYIIVEDADGYGVFDLQATPLTSFEYDKIKIRSEKNIYLYKDSTILLFNPTNNTKINCTSNSFFKNISINEYIFHKNLKLILYNKTTDVSKEFDLDSISNIFTFQENTQTNNIAGIFESKLEAEKFYYTYKSGKIGLLNENLNIFIPTNYVKINYDIIFAIFIVAKTEIFNNYGWRQTSTYTDFGAYDNTGKLIIPIIYKQISNLNSLILVSNGAFGLYNSKGKLVVPIEYFEIISVTNNNFKIYKNNKVGFVDSVGNICIKPKYDGITYLNDKFLKVRNNGKTGIVNKNGRIIIPIKYSAISFINNKLFFIKQNKKYGLASLSGKILIKPQFDKMTVLSDKLIKVKKDNKYGAVNYNGKGIIPIVYKNITTTSNKNIYYTKSNCKIDTIAYSTKTKQIEDVNTNLFGVVNNYGEILLDTLYLQLKIKTYQEYITVKMDTTIIVVSIDLKGKFIEKLELRNFFPVRVLGENKKNFWQYYKKSIKYDAFWGLISTNNRILIDYKFENYYPNFINDSNLVMTVLNNRYGIVNQSIGREMQTCSYSELITTDLDSANVFRAVINYGTCNLINKDGTSVLKKPAYIDDFTDFNTRIAFDGRFIIKKKRNIYHLNVNGTHAEGYNELVEGKWGVVDENGKYLIEPSYLFIQKQFKKQYIAQNNKRKWGVIDKYENRLIDFEYDGIKYFTKQPDIHHWIDIEFLKAKKGKKWGVIDASNQQIIDYKYDDLKYFGNDKGHFFGVCKNKKWGVVDISDNIIVPIEFDSIQYFNKNNKLMFQTFNLKPRSGFIDTNGVAVVTPIYVKVENFSEGFARVELGKKKWSFINSSYNLITDSVYNKVRDFSDGFAAVKKGKLWGFINTKGELLIEPQFYDVGDFNSGMAYVKTKQPKKLFLKSKSKYGYIDTNGTLKIKLKYKKCSDFNGEIAFVRKRKKYAIINKKGKTKTGYKYKKFVLNKDYDVSLGITNNKKYALFNADGKKLVREGKFNKIENFSDSLAIVKKKKMYGYIDTKGELIIEPKYEKANAFSSGFAVIKKDKMFGFVDKKGLEIEPKYKKCKNFIDSIAMVTDMQKNTFCINKNGKKVEDENIRNKYLNNFEKYSLVYQNKRYYYFNTTTKQTIDKQFLEANKYENGKAIVRLKNKKYGMINNKGSYLIEPKTDKLYNFNNNHAIYTLFLQTGLYDCSGKQLAPNTFIEIIETGNLIKLINTSQCIYINKTGEVIWK